MIYDIEFENIGRSRAIPPATAEAPLNLTRSPAQVVAARVSRYARQFLAARFVGVEVDMADDLTGSGAIYAGGQHVGTFTIRPRGAEA